MRKTVLALFFLFQSCLIAGLREGREAYLQCDLQKYFSSLVESMVTNPQSARSAVILDYLDELRGTVTNFPAVTNAYIALMRNASNGIVRVSARRALSSVFLRMGRLENAADLLRQNGLITSWKILGPFIDAGKSDLGTVFPFEKNGFRLDKATSNYAGRVLPLNIGPFTPEGWVAPFYPYGSKQGVVYMVSWFSISRDGEYNVGLTTDESCEISIDSCAPARVNGFTHDPGRNTWYLFALNAGWHRIVIKVLKTTSFPSVSVCVLDKNWSLPEGFVFSQEIHPIPQSQSKCERITVFPESWYKTRIDTFKADAEDRFWYGLALLTEGQEDEFVRQINQAVSLDPKNLFYKMFFSFFCVTRNEYPNSGRIEQALTWLRSPALKAYDMSRTLIGLNLSYNNMTREAGKILRAETGSNPGNFLAWHYLAELSLKQKWDEEFLRFENRALKLNPCFTPGLERMMRYWQFRNPALALDWAGKLATQDPLLFSAAASPILLNDSGQADQALELEKKLMTFFPEMKELYFFLADTLMRLGRTNSAGEAWDETVSKYPCLPEALQKAGDFFLLTGKTAKGLQLLKRSLVLDPSDIVTADKISFHETRMPFTLDTFMDRKRQSLLLQNALNATNKTPSGSVIVDDEEVLKINPDGTWHSLVYQLVRVTGKDGIARWGSSSIDNYPRMKIMKARTWLRNGEIVDTSQIQKQGPKRVINFPVLEEDSVIELEYLISGFWNRVSGTECFYSYPQLLQTMEDDIQNGTYKLIMPAGKRFNIITGNFSGRTNITMRTEVFADSTIITVMSRFAHGIPKESSLPQITDIVPTFQVSIFPGGADLLGRWVRGLMDSVQAVSPELDLKLFELSENRDLKNSGLELIRKIYYWVQDSILVDDTGLYSPDNSRRTLDNRSGSVENKMMLMKCFLDRLGVGSVPVLVRTTDLAEGDFSHLNPSLFNDCLLRVELRGRSGVWLDFSSRFFPFGSIGWDKFGAQGFDTVSSTLLKVPTFSSVSNRAEYENNVFLGDNGRLSMKCRRTWRGGARIYNELYDDPGTRESVVHQIENRSIKGLSISNIVFSKPDEREIFGYSFDADPGPFMEKRQDGLHLPLPGIRALFVENYISGKERHNPLKIYTPVDYFQKVMINIGNRNAVSLPKDIDLHTPFGTYSMKTAAVTNGRILMEIEAALSSQTISVKDYPAFLDFCQKVDDAEKEEIVLTP